MFAGLVFWLMGWTSTQGLWIHSLVFDFPGNNKVCFLYFNVVISYERAIYLLLFRISGYQNFWIAIKILWSGLKNQLLDEIRFRIISEVIFAGFILWKILSSQLRRELFDKIYSRIMSEVLSARFVFWSWRSGLAFHLIHSATTWKFVVFLE